MARKLRDPSPSPPAAAAHNAGLQGFCVDAGDLNSGTHNQEAVSLTYCAVSQAPIKYLVK